MRGKAVFWYLAWVLRLISLLMAVPLSIALFQRDWVSLGGFAATIAAMMALALLLLRLGRGMRKLSARDGFVLVAVCWIAVSVFGAVPFYFSGAFPGLVDCLFESVSGFTTTGSTILPNVEALPMAIQFWRCQTHWIGGMGVLVFLMAVVPSAEGEQTMHILRAETTGPTPGKLVPRLRQSAKILYAIYLGLTVLEIALLVLGKMPLFDAVCNAMSTVGTGGFALKNASIAAYDSLYIEMVISVFMVLCGINFSLYYFLLVGNFRDIRKNQEFRVYLGLVALATGAIAVNLTLSTGTGLGRSLRQSLFQVASITTTTGFSTADFTLWPMFSQIILLMLLFMGGSAGSTAGGFKVSRLLILCKETKRVFHRMASPRSVRAVKLDGKAVDPPVVHSVGAYFFTLVLIAAGSALVVALDGYDFETTATAVLTCVSNVGPGLGMVSPVGNFSAFSPLSKLVLSLGMLAGRLEIYPVLVLFLPRTWKKG